MRVVDLIRLVLLASIWGASFIFVRVLSPVIGPVMTADFRVLIAGIFLCIYFKIAGIETEWRRLWKEYLAVGTLNSGFPFLLYAWAALYVPASYLVIINSTSPLFGAVCSAYWLGERLTLLKITGLLLGAAGVALIVRYTLSRTQSHVWVGSARVTRLSHLLRPFRDLRQEVGSLNEADYAGRSEPACDRYAAFSSRAPGPSTGNGHAFRGHEHPRSCHFMHRSGISVILPPAGRRGTHQGSDGHLPDTGLRHALEYPLPVRDSHSGNDGRMRPHCYGHRARDQEGLELCSLSVNRSVPGELRLCRSLSRPRIHRIHLCGAH